MTEAKPRNRKGSEAAPAQPGSSTGSGAFLILAMCIAEILSMMGAFAFPSLLPKFFSEWHLTNTEAGWINGVYFAGYTVAVPVLAGLTDRLDGRGIYLISAGVSAAATFGFGFWANGFWSALFFRSFCGLGLAGTFIPGLKALVDRLDGSVQARAVAFYTANFSMGLSLSFFASGRIEALWGWRWAFIVAAAGTLLALPLAAIVLRPLPPRPVKKQTEFFLDFRPILRNRTAMAYILAYTAHMWELFAFRSWFVAFLAFSLSLDSSGLGHWQPSSVAAVSGLIAMWANIAGSELALRYGRLKVLTLIMGGSAVFGCILGFTAGMSYTVVSILCVFYCFFVQGDSGTLHTGVVQAADPQRRGATMAFQSLIGFASASISPLVVGMFLDLTGGGKTIESWGLSFIPMAGMVALGPAIIALLTRHPKPVKNKDVF